MVKADRILREVFPGREVFTDVERRLVERVISAVNNDAPRSRIPRTDIPVGREFEMDGVRLVVCRRGVVYEPKDACMGCWFKTEGRSCYGLRCSSFDRADRANVWFVNAAETEKR